MPDRTDWDELVDEAIELLEDDATEQFALVTFEETDVHALNATNDHSLLVAIYLLGRELQDRIDEDVSIPQIAQAAVESIGMTHYDISSYESSR